MAASRQAAIPFEPPNFGLIDNRTVLHTSHHKNGKTAGYRIVARYLL